MRGRTPTFNVKGPSHTTYDLLPSADAHKSINYNGCVARYELMAAIKEMGEEDQIGL